MEDKRRQQFEQAEESAKVILERTTRKKDGLGKAEKKAKKANARAKKDEGDLM